MDGLTLLAEAETAGLTVAVDGDRLVIRGPKRLESLAKRLIAHKSAVFSALTARAGSGPATAGARPDVPPGWTATTWAAELRRKAQRCEAQRPELAERYRRTAAGLLTQATAR